MMGALLRMYGTNLKLEVRSSCSVCRESIFMYMVRSLQPKIHQRRVAKKKSAENFRLTFAGLYVLHIISLLVVALVCYS